MNKTIATAILAAGLGIGGLSLAGAASAGDDTDETPTSDQPAGLVAPAQTDEPPAEPAPAEEAPEDGEPREGCRGGRSLGIAAETLGMEVDELRAALDEGQTIAGLASANGVDPQAIVDASIERSEERLAEKVAAGEITQEEADERLAEKTERINDRVLGDSATS